MSTYSKQTKHPVTGEWHEATWMDDFYGRHRYGVRFPNGETFNPDKIQLETREDEPQESTTKERFEDAYQRFQLCDEICALDMKKLWAFIAKEIALAYEQGRNAKGSSFRLGYEAMRSEVVAEERERMIEYINDEEMQMLAGDCVNDLLEHRGIYDCGKSMRGSIEIVLTPISNNLKRRLSSLDKPLSDKK